MPIFGYSIMGILPPGNTPKGSYGILWIFINSLFQASNLWSCQGPPMPILGWSIPGIPLLEHPLSFNGILLSYINPH